MTRTKHRKDLPGSMYKVFTPTAFSQSRTALAVNSNPLSDRMYSCTNAHCHVNRVGPQRPAWIPFQAAALALSHTLNASFRNRLKVSRLHK